ncbi:unnamed protein product [Onchocerca ochengi]|uniref:ATP-dependent DNA helicase n=1 Tax=Onchocerca ochengi TaxID=42157 RepID=A0A182EKV3_ONCOC|nr:unnamed protein product [Onchocerca ochengi]
MAQIQAELRAARLGDAVLHLQNDRSVRMDTVTSIAENWERKGAVVDTIAEADEAVKNPTEFLNSLDLPGMPPHVLHLKIGVPIIMPRNINQPKLCNGRVGKQTSQYQHRQWNNKKYCILTCIVKLNILDVSEADVKKTP